MDLREIRWDGVDWIDTAKDRDQWRSDRTMVLGSVQRLPEIFLEVKGGQPAPKTDFTAICEPIF
jgi:hypothetical protein